MTPDPITALLLEIRRETDAVRNSVATIERAVKGDPDSDTPSIRKAISDLKVELDAETDSLNDRVEALETKVIQSEAYLKGLTTIAKWLGGTSLGTLLALIAQLLGVFGGGK
ncbi:hypothetical protein [Deinococcus rufus]|uniref:DUF1640 domain-containing protein n=1 Tax=Deinococcus rufus TaxID=2136097 RepID=A0ABV7Z7Y4_9DEIO